MDIMTQAASSFDMGALAMQKAKSFSLNADNNLSKKEIQETAQNFEAFFITKMMESMYEGVSTDGMFGGGHAEKIYRSMLLDEYGKSMAKTGQVGVADTVMRSILEMQEMASQGYISAETAKS